MRGLECLRHLRGGMPGEVHVVLDVAADGHLVVRHVPELHQRVAGQLELVDRVVLELEIGRDLHQLGPVGTRPVAHRSPFSIDQWMSILTTPRSPSAG